MARIAFLMSAIRRVVAGQPRTCPHCHSHTTILLQRKKLLLELRRCQGCSLMFRYPKDDLETNVTFYQKAYREGITTDVPTTDRLKQLLESNFKGSSKDMTKNIELVKREKSEGRLIDYGCSWGYGVYQFCRAGYEAIGFEMSKPRAAYGRKYLSVDIIDSYDELEGLEPASFDVIHTNHVLEHLPELRVTFSAFRRLLKPGGLLFIVVPNAGGKRAHEHGVKWGPMIGEKHNLALDAKFFARNLPEFGFLPVFSTSPYEQEPLAYQSEEHADLALQGDELMVTARRLGSAYTHA